MQGKCCVSGTLHRLVRSDPFRFPRPDDLKGSSPAPISMICCIVECRVAHPLGDGDSYQHLPSYGAVPPTDRKSRDQVNHCCPIQPGLEYVSTGKCSAGSTINPPLAKSHIDSDAPEGAACSVRVPPERLSLHSVIEFRNISAI